MAFVRRAAQHAQQDPGPAVKAGQRGHLLAASLDQRVDGHDLAGGALDAIGGQAYDVDPLHGHEPVQLGRAGHDPVTDHDRGLVGA